MYIITECPRSKGATTTFLCVHPVVENDTGGENTLILVEQILALYLVTLSGSKHLSREGEKGIKSRREPFVLMPDHVRDDAEIGTSPGQFEESALGEWCIALASILCIGGWYARTHPTTGNDQVIQRLARLLGFLTFGLTDAASPDMESEETSRKAEREQDAPARS
jgi:hypothetical protein